MRRAFPLLAHANLPTAITALNALLGIAGIALASRGHSRGAVTCVALAIPCDVLDGWLARRMGTTSRFGAELDTLADATSFCLLPAASALALVDAPWIALPAGLYALAGLLRLARFAVVGTTADPDEPRFEGVPTPFSAAIFVLVSAVARHLPPGFRGLTLAAFFLVAAPAMISALPFPKRGAYRLALWVLVPIAGLSLWVGGAA